jgi:hypothetical protein
MPSDGPELYRASIYDETPDFTRILADRRTRADEKELGRKGQWCPGAESNHRHCDFQSHALPTELPGRRPDQVRERRFIVRPDSPVHLASPSASRGAASPSRRRSEPGIARRATTGRPHSGHFRLREAQPRQAEGEASPAQPEGRRRAAPDSSRRNPPIQPDPSVGRPESPDNVSKSG